MKCSEGMLKRPVYAALLWLIVATFVVTALPLKGWYNYYQEREAANVAKQLSTPEGTARINKIATAALAKGELTGEQYAKTVLDIRDIEMRMDHAVGINDSVPQLAAITKIPGSVMGGLSAYLTREQEQRYGSLGMDWAAIGSLLVIGCMFIPLAFLILAMRLAMMARTPRQLLVMFRAEWLELVGASLCWGVGLGVYKPHESCSLMDKIRQLGYREDEDTSIDWEAKRTHVLELISRGRFDAVSPLQTVWAMLKVIWGGSWRHAGFGVRFGYAKQAVYVSLVGTLMVMAGQVKAYASGDNFVLQRVMLNYSRNLSVGGPATENLFLTFKGGVNAAIYGYSSAHPVYELAVDVTKLKLLNGSLTLGPFADCSGTGKLTSYGVSGFAAIKLGNATLTGPVYFTRDAKGHNGFLAPNIRLTWSAGKSFSYGLGGAAFASDGNKPTFLLGPILNIKGRATTLSIRLGQFLSGHSRGQTQLRLDIAFAP